MRAILNKKLLLLLFIFPLFSFAQIDSVKESNLPNVIVKAYDQGKRWKDIPAAINFVSKNNLERFSPTSIVQAVNSTPGVRMEERSPGSYRLNIRGSSLRSPFGVRNVKVYYNDIPITDPGGHTYLNQLGYYNFNSIEIIKGPGSSLYGAGTGGVLMIESLSGNEQSGLFSEYATGSYDLQNIYGSTTIRRENNISKLGVQHQENGGYRNHSALRKDVYSWNGLYRITENSLLKTTFLYGNLFYETPGALTRAEYEANPKASRPGNAFFPGAEAAKASVRQHMFIAGASYDQQLSSKWKNKSVAYGMFTELRNPTIQNYGRSSEPHVGGRTTFQFNQRVNKGKFSFDAGAELQQGFTNVGIYKNVGGNPDTLQYTDEINNRQALVFSQAVLDFNHWTITGGASLNFLKVRFERFVPFSLGKQSRNFNNQITPRFAIARQIKDITIYSSVAKGFSPPTTAELLPTGGSISFGLNAEQGVNYDIGAKGNLLRNLFVDVNAFRFSLKNTIVQRRTSGGGDFFVNAGETKQYGVETYISYPLLQSSMQKSLFWLSHTYHHFKYDEFKQLTANFSGNYLPAEAKNTISTGFDFLMPNGFLGTVSYYYSSKIPLNDANTEYAGAYHLVGAKVGYQTFIKAKLRLKLFIGVDNLLNRKYSLGNDINGFGGRYYNAAPSRNYYAAIVLDLSTTGR
ncbi:MAG TPA: TonB-dependent receptor plug domain-containing protein [Flavisolibacter sp.]|jgi:iron complex outermembrane receptor protein|nr:TonB-dependent receptor plug domain-containing protein [Flavisolibacter sp.]